MCLPLKTPVFQDSPKEDSIYALMNPLSIFKTRHPCADAMRPPAKIKASNVPSCRVVMFPSPSREVSFPLFSEKRGTDLRSEHEHRRCGFLLTCHNESQDAFGRRRLLLQKSDLMREKSLRHFVPPTVGQEQSASGGPLLGKPQY